MFVVQLNDTTDTTNDKIETGRIWQKRRKKLEQFYEHMLNGCNVLGRKKESNRNVPKI